jgi:DNA-binding GntR family transcriptional regulator
MGTSRGSATTEMAKSESDPPQVDADTSGSTVDRVVAAVRARVASGEYAPGHHLVEAELTQEFGVSRGPVREAFRRLAAEGLLTQEHNRGTRVRRFGPDDIRSLYELREMLEGLAARLAATRVRQADYRSRLRAIAEDMRTAFRALDVDGYYVLNERLHELLVEMSANSYLQGMVEQLRLPAMRVLFRKTDPVERTRRSHPDHERLLRAVLRGDAEGAELAMRQHIRNSAAFVAPEPAGVGHTAKRRASSTRN